MCLTHKGILGKWLIILNMGLLFLWIFWSKNKSQWKNGFNDKTSLSKSGKERETLGEMLNQDYAQGTINPDAFGSRNNRRRYYICIIILVVAMNIIRFMNLDQSPPGFSTDEAANAVCIQCLAEEGVDSIGKPYPFFSQIGLGTPRPPVLLYFGMVWTKLFGFSITSFRAISASLALLSVVGLYFLSKLFFDYRYSLFVTLAASISPWMFHLSRISGEFPFANCFMIWGLYFFLKSHKYFDMLLSGILLSLAMYSYFPFKTLVLLGLFPLLYLKHRHQGLKMASMAVFFMSFIGFSSPLIQGAFIGSYLGEIEREGIFSNTYLASVGRSGTVLDSLIIFFNNFIRHLSAPYLFFKGDPNLLHSTQFTGQFSWLDTSAVILGIGLLIQMISKEDSVERLRHQSIDVPFVIFLLINIGIGIIPSALNSLNGDPDALRSIGILPFVSLLTGYILWKSVNKWKLILPGIVGISLLFAYLFLWHYFFEYPRISYEFYDTSLKDSAQVAKALDSQKIVKGLPPGMSSENIWEQIIWKYYPHHIGVQARYYLMNYRGEGCSESREHFLTSRKLISSSLSAEEYNNLGIRLAQQEDYEEAIKHFSAAIQRDPQYAEAHKNLGMLWSTLGQSQKALDSLMQAHQILLSHSTQTPELKQEIDKILERIALEMQKQKAGDN